MKIPLYLSMTAAEFAACQNFPRKIGWMACHFSPYCTGLSNIPASLPPGSLLIINDITPIHGHDPQRIFHTLQDLIAAFQCGGVLLDFQRGGSDEAARLVKKLLELPAAVGVTEKYAAGHSCPIFLPPSPIRQEIKDYLSPWQGREIWLEAALSKEAVRVTADGSRLTDYENGLKALHQDKTLYCHYGIKADDHRAAFCLQRTPEDLLELLNAAEDMGVTRAVGLYQEFKEFPLFISPDL